ncbi:MAG: hypothetical protein KAS30_04370 [Candidatus Diapherotrites archaeon]|nr:hypothetical protein [Candidatus Diapherotrites archaeon]
MIEEQESEILMEVAIGKGLMRKLPSYLKNNEGKICKKTVAEEALFD